MLARGISKDNLVSIDSSIPSTLNAPGIGLKPNLQAAKGMMMQSPKGD